jgi:hypothetical protein
MKFNSLVSIAVCLGLSSVSMSAFANSSESNAGKMHVQISNETGVICQLTNQVLHHGIFESSPPRSIMANDSKFFDMDQAKGPDVELSYNCGTGPDGTINSISFEVQQDYSLIFGHTPNVTILSSKGLAIESTNLSGSTFYNNNGISNVTIKLAS